MNHYIYAQILNMQAMAKTFGQSCELAAMKDDGQISKDEVKQLKRIKAAVEAFCKELDKVNTQRDYRSAQNTIDEIERELNDRK